MQLSGCHSEWPFKRLSHKTPKRRIPGWVPASKGDSSVAALPQNDMDGIVILSGPSRAFPIRLQSEESRPGFLRGRGRGFFAVVSEGQGV